jgi:hypothetical protein
MTNLSSSIDSVPPSPTPDVHYHTCPKCSLPIGCTKRNERHYPTEKYITKNNEIYHLTCMTASSQHEASSSKTKKNLTQTFQNILHESSQTTNPLTTSSHQTLISSDLIDSFFSTTTNTNPITNQPPTTNTLDTSSLNLNKTSNINQSENTPNKPPSQSYSSVLKPKSNPTYDWVANFPITEEMQPNKKLQTSFSLQLFTFLKKFLYDFYPGKKIKPATATQPALKASFYYIIRIMAGQCPEFLTDLIYNSNPNIDKSATIPFDLLESTLKNLLLKFTTVLFTKLNYLEIFASPVTIPPYTAHNHLQLCLNLA